MSSMYQKYIWKKWRFSLPVYLLTLLFILPDTLILGRDLKAQVPGDNLGYIPSLNADVTSVRFYESDYDHIPYGKREYKVQFPKSSSRAINWELNLRSPVPERRIDFEIVEIWYRPGGSQLTKQSLKTYMDIEPNWTSSAYNDGWGWKEAGNWEVGDYRVDLFIEGQKVASGTFSIYSGTEPIVPPASLEQKEGVKGKDTEGPDDLGDL